MPTITVLTWPLTESLDGWSYDYDVWREAELSSCISGTISPHSGSLLADSTKGTRVGDTECWKDIDVSSLSADIDAGDMDYDWGGWLAGYAPDLPKYALVFLDAADAVIGSKIMTAGSNTCSWVEQRLTGTVPALTRTIRAILRSEHNSGSYNNGIFDDFTLDLTSPSITSPGVRTSALLWRVIAGRPETLKPRVSSVTVSPMAIRDRTIHTRVSALVLKAFVFRAPESTGRRVKSCSVIT